IVYNRNLIPQPHSPSFLSDALCYNACEIAKAVQANALIGMTQSGYTGFMLSSFRPRSPLFVFTKTQSLVNQLSLSWGVTAFFYDQEESIDQMIADQCAFLKIGRASCREMVASQREGVKGGEDKDAHSEIHKV